MLMTSGVEEFPSATLRSIRAKAREIALQVTEPRAEEVDRDAFWPEHTMQALASEGLLGLHVSFTLTFRRKEKDCLHVIAHPASSRPAEPVMVDDHADPTVFTTALGLAGVSTEFESTLSVAAEEAWRTQGVEVCCEAIDLMAGQLENLSFRLIVDKTTSG